MKAQTKTTQPSLMKALTLGVLLAAGSMSFSTSASAAACAAEKWTEGSQYKAGNVVRYRDHNYEVAKTHTAAVGGNWTPPAIRRYGKTSVNAAPQPRRAQRLRRAQRQSPRRAADPSAVVDPLVVAPAAAVLSVALVADLAVLPAAARY
jgi:hypothetical protein